MTSHKQCLKCGHNVQYDAEPPLACPSCGAVYSKVEQALREGLPSRPQPTPKPLTGRAPTTDVDHHAFASQLREESIYPTFRAVANLLYWCGVVLAVLILLGGLSLAMRAGIAAAIGGVAGAVLVFVLARVGKEMSLMLADLSDATVRMAAHAEGHKT